MINNKLIIDLKNKQIKGYCTKATFMEQMEELKEMMKDGKLGFES